MEQHQRAALSECCSSWCSDSDVTSQRLQDCACAACIGRESLKVLSRRYCGVRPTAQLLQHAVQEAGIVGQLPFKLMWCQLCQPWCWCPGKQSHPQITHGGEGSCFHNVDIVCITGMIAGKHVCSASAPVLRGRRQALKGAACLTRRGSRVSLKGCFVLLILP